MNMSENIFERCSRNAASQPQAEPAEFVGQTCSESLRRPSVWFSLFLALSAALAFMRGVGHWLVKEDSLQKANAHPPVLSGNFPCLALSGKPPRFIAVAMPGKSWLTHPGPESEVFLAEMGIHYP